MHRSLFILVLTLCLSSSLFAQNTLFKITGTVLDEATQLPLKSSNVQIIGSLRGSTTDSNGVFSFSIAEKDVALKFSSIGYEDKFIKVNYKLYDNLVVVLSQKTQVLNEIIINSSPIETVVKSKNNNVLDYDFYKENILLITYGNSLSKSKLILINQSFDTISKINIPEEPTQLFKDCLGNIHVICENNMYQVYLDSSNLRFLPAENIKNFEKILYPCVAEDSSNLYIIKKEGSELIDVGAFRPFYSHNHTISYSYINKFNKKRNSLAAIVDEETTQLRNDEGQIEKSKQNAGMYKHGSQAQDRIFLEIIVIKEIFAPLYKIHDTIYIFDYINSNIQSYSSNGRLLKKIGIKFHLGKNWKREMCVDEKNAKAFAIFESNGITEIKEVNIATGEINQSYKIPFTFIKNIKANDGYIYFLYKGKDYQDTRYLSRLKIN